MDVLAIEWDGVEYELKYSFKIVRRLRAEGINVPQIYRSIASNPDGAGDFGDDFASIASIILRDHGAAIKEEDMWRACLGDPDAMAAAARVFYWVVENHFASPSSKVPQVKKPTRARKPKA